MQVNYSSDVTQMSFVILVNQTSHTEKSLWREVEGMYNRANKASSVFESSSGISNADLPEGMPIMSI